MSLAKQDLPSEEYEVLIVDNASSDGTKEVIQSFSREYPQVRYLHEEKLGLSFARNHGLQAAQSPYVAYTDDDAVVPRDWLHRLTNRFDTLDPKPIAVGGEIEPVWEVGRPSWLTDAMLRPLSAHLGWSPTPCYLQGDQWICEVNSAYQRDALLRYGGFPGGLGRRGNNLLSGENIINEVMRRDGHAVFFDPDIRVRHFIPKSRATKAWFRRRYFWQGISSCLVADELRRHSIAGQWRFLELPASGEDWINLFDDYADDSSFERVCDRLAHVGYLLSLKGLIDGR